MVEGQNIINDFFLIYRDYTELIKMDAPILYSGKNRYNGKVIGSIAFDDDDNDQYYFFQTPVEEDDYFAFLNKKVTLRQLYNKQKYILELVRKYNNEIVSTTIKELAEVNQDLLPREDSYCPDVIVPNSTNFGFALKGKLAESHKALVGDINVVQQKILEALQESVSLVQSSLPFDAKIYLQPSEVSSFRINFDVEFEEIQTASKQFALVFYKVSKQKLLDFYYDYIDYVLRKLPQGEENLMGNTDASPAFQKVKEKLSDLYREVDFRVNVEEYLVNAISHTAAKVAKVTAVFKDNNSFSRIVLNKNIAGANFEYGDLTESYLENIQEKILLPEDDDTTTVVNEITTDDVDKPYRILVTHFGETGVGRAKLFTDASENFYRIRLKVNIPEGQSATHSKFTNSLHEPKVIDVMGKMKWVNDKYDTLTCDL